MPTAELVKASLASHDRMRDVACAQDDGQPAGYRPHRRAANRTGLDSFGFQHCRAGRCDLRHLPRAAGRAP